MKRSVLFVILAFALPAMALNTRSAVSVNGVDTNPCTTASPCRSFSAAIAVTSAGGEIIALDSAGYGPFSVTTSMTVSGAPGVHAALTVTSGDGITVTATPTDSVTLRNLLLLGFGANSGVNAGTAGEVRVLGCTITGFGGSAIFASSQLLTVDRCDLLSNHIGVGLVGQTTAVEAFIGDSLIENHDDGISLNPMSAAVHATIFDCRIVAVSASAVAASGNTVVVAVVDSSVLSRGNNAVTAGSSGATIYLANSEIAFFNTGAVVVPGASVKSYGNNRFSVVTTVGTLSAVSLQ